MRRREWPEIGAVFANKTLAFTGDSHVRFVHNWIAVHLGGEQQLTQRRRRLPAPASWPCAPHWRPPGFSGWVGGPPFLPALSFELPDACRATPRAAAGQILIHERGKPQMENVKYQTLPGNISLRIHMTYQPPETTALLQGW